MRVALGVAYRGSAYHGWQSQPSGRTVQDKLEAALGEFAAMPVSTAEHPLCPVCGMDVDPATAPKSVFKGTTYYFCSDDDKKTFDAAPDKFVNTDRKNL